MEWTQDNIMGFIELHEKMSFLWDPNHPRYYNKLHKHLPTRRSEQLVDHSAQPFRLNERRFVRTYTAGRAEEPRALTLRQIAEVWTRPKTFICHLSTNVKISDTVVTWRARLITEKLTLEGPCHGSGG